VKVFENKGQRNLILLIQEELIQWGMKNITFQGIQWFKLLG